jgi:hypothetical protein
MLIVLNCTVFDILIEIVQSVVFFICLSYQRKPVYISNIKLTY